MNSTRRKTMLTLVSSVSVQICNVLISLLIPRVIIAIYGSDTNGIISAARQFSQYLSLMETSITAATCYRFIEFNKSKNYEKIRSLFFTIGEFYKKVGTIIAGIAIIIALFYAVTSKTMVDILTVIAIFLLYESIYVLSYRIYYKYNFILFADGKQYFIAFGTVVTSLTAAVVNYIMAINRWHIILLAGSGIVIDIIRLEIIKRKVENDYPYLKTNEKTIDNSLLDQKWDSLIMSISDSVKYMIPVLCISIAYGSSFVSVFSIYQTVMHLGTSIIIMCSNGLLPTLGSRFTESSENTSEAFRLFHLVVLLVGSIISVCFFGMIINFISLYIGEGADISYVYPVLAFFLIINTWLTMVRAPFDLIIKARGKIRELRDGCLIEIIITVCVSIIMCFLGRFEYIAIGMVLSSLYRIWRMIRYTADNLKVSKTKSLLMDCFFWLSFTLFFGIISYWIIPSSNGVFQFAVYAVSILVMISIIAFIILFVIYRKQIKPFVARISIGKHNKS